MGAPQPNVPDLAVDWTDSTPTVYRIISDHLGSPRVVVDVSDGTVMLAINYDVFGKPEKVGGADDWDLDTLPFGFAGGMFDEETGLVRFGARDYDPMTGRWTAKDPILWSGGQANLYVYLRNDPVNRIDPTGAGDLTTDVAQCVVESTYCAFICANPATRPECGQCLASAAQACKRVTDRIPDRPADRPRDDDWEAPPEWPHPWPPDDANWYFRCRDYGECACLETWEGPEG